MTTNSCTLSHADRTQAAFLLWQISVDQDHLSCPITSELFTEPSITPCGHTFEASRICESLKRRKSCPLDRKDLKSDDLLTNHFVKQISEIAKEIIDKNLIVMFFNIDDDLPRCPINGKPLFEAVRLPCGHYFNQSALSSFYKDHQFCPLDNFYFDISDATPDPYIRDAVDKAYPRHLAHMEIFNDALDVHVSTKKLDDRNGLIPKMTKLIKCPLSNSIIQDPVIAQCGHTFDKNSINTDSICPYDELKITKVFSNRLAKDILEKLRVNCRLNDVVIDKKGVFLVLDSRKSNLFRIKKITAALGIADHFNGQHFNINEQIFFDFKIPLFEILNEVNKRFSILSPSGT